MMVLQRTSWLQRCWRRRLYLGLHLYLGLGLHLCLASLVHSVLLQTVTLLADEPSVRPVPRQLFSSAFSVPHALAMFL